jgi:hypothetical protein
MWLDTDMQIIREIKFNELLLKSKSIYFARHPGFVFSARSFSKLALKRKLRILVSYFRAFSHLQLVLGDWETRRESTAFVSNLERKNYVHGAVWVGEVRNVLAMCKQLAENIDFDLDKKLVAKWHDESHLNWYASNFSDVSFLPKNFSGWVKSWQFDVSNTYVLSLDKTELRSLVAEENQL